MNKIAAQLEKQTLSLDAMTKAQASQAEMQSNVQTKLDNISDAIGQLSQAINRLCDLNERRDTAVAESLNKVHDKLQDTIDDIKAVRTLDD